MRSGGQEEGEGGKVEVGAIGRRHASALGPLSVVFCQMDVAHTNGSRAQNGQRAEPLDALAMERQQEQAFVLKHGSLNIRRNLLKKPSTRKRFDSGEWALEIIGLSCEDSVPCDVPVDQLSPKLAPEGTPMQRTRSRLEAMLLEMDSDKEHLGPYDH